MTALAVISLNGLRADSLGDYLASLGLFSLVAREWPTVRAVWRDANFCLVGGPATLEQIVEFVAEIGNRNTWSPYDRPWNDAKERDKKKKNTKPIETLRWRALEAEEKYLPNFGAHLALDDRVRMNPLLGYGGMIGQRKFYAGWQKATKCIDQHTDSLMLDLEAYLMGDVCTQFLDKYNGGSWFGAANKIYNHGTRRPHREGKITPWAMALACEGLTYFSGGSSRQLGSRWQPKGAFPFVTTAMAPIYNREPGRIEAEVWLPIWNQPVTTSELESLYVRGRAEINGKGATSSAKFAVAIIHRGVDSGLEEFRRFSLLPTTSNDYFESRLTTVVPVPKARSDDTIAETFQTIIEFLDTLPPDKKVRGQWRFNGLCGPLERALTDFAALRSEDVRTEQAWALVDQVIGVLVKVDRNRTFRSQKVRFQLLPGRWATQLFQEDPPDREARLALAISSLTGVPPLPQIIAHRIGVQKRGRGPYSYWEFPDSTPARRIWSDTALSANLEAVAERRTMDALREMASRHPFSATIRVDLADLQAWLSGDVDEERMSLWLDRLCVFDWSGDANNEAASELRRDSTDSRPAIDGALALYALLRPLASDWLFRQILRQSGVNTKQVSTCAHLGRVIAMLRRGDAPAAAETAIGVYRSAGVAIADFDALPAVYCPERLLASLVIPVYDYQVLAVFQRWRSPAETMEA